MQSTELSASDVRALCPLVERAVSPFDLKRLEGYARNLVDFHLVMDLVPMIAKLHFGGEVRHAVRLPHVQAAVLLGVGLQFKRIEELEAELNLQAR